MLELFPLQSPLDFLWAAGHEDPVTPVAVFARLYNPDRILEVLSPFLKISEILGVAAVDKEGEGNDGEHVFFLVVVVEGKVLK